MRQAGRYMAAFREYSDKYPFRMRSETPEIAIELSLQPWKAFKTDGIIFFSDILTPLPALGVEFDVIKGKGPRIDNPLRSMEQVKQLKPLDDPSSSLPFIHEILSTIRWGEVSVCPGRQQQVLNNLCCSCVWLWLLLLAATGCSYHPRTHLQLLAGGAGGQCSTSSGASSAPQQAGLCCGLRPLLPVYQHSQLSVVVASQQHTVATAAADWLCTRGLVQEGDGR
jgi:hypothetical protein